MNKYNKEASCPKCGCTGINNQYLSKSSLYGVRPVDEKYIDLPDYIKRTCFNCGYSWDELPLDAGED